MAARFEFRVFGARLCAPSAALEAALASGEAVADGDEEVNEDTYLVVAVRSDASLKLREGALDLKRLVGLSGDLEQWQPAGRAAFPVDGARLAQDFLRPAGIEVDPGSGPTDAEAVLRLVRAAGARTVPVGKRRRRWRLDGARVEVAHVALEGRVLESMAVEHEDAGVVERARTRLGLGAARNVSYPRLLAEACEDG